MYLFSCWREGNRIALKPSSSRFWPNTTCWIWTIFDRLKMPFSGPQMQKRFHIHKEQGLFSLFVYKTSRGCFLLVTSIKAMLIPVSPSAHKNGVRIRKIQKTIKQSWIRAEVIWPIHFFHVNDVKFDCLNVLLKPEKVKTFCKIRIFYLIEYFKVIIVTDRKCSVADNVVLANLIKIQLIHKVLSINKSLTLIKGHNSVEN